MRPDWGVHLDVDPQVVCQVIKHFPAGENTVALCVGLRRYKIHTSLDSSVLFAMTLHYQMGILE